MAVDDVVVVVVVVVVEEEEEEEEETGGHASERFAYVARAYPYHGMSTVMVPSSPDSEADVVLLESVMGLLFTVM